MALSKERQFLNCLALKTVKLRGVGPMIGKCEVCAEPIRTGQRYRGDARKVHEDCFQARCKEVTR